MERNIRALVCVCLASLGVTGTSSGQLLANTEYGAQVLVKIQPGSEVVLEQRIQSLFPGAGVERTFLPPSPLRCNKVGIDLVHTVTVPSYDCTWMAESLAAEPWVEWVETIDWEKGVGGGAAGVWPTNDPLLGSQWPLNQANDVDMDVPEAWMLRDTAIADGDLIVAIVDTGHEIDGNSVEFAGSLWTNPDEVFNGLDDDANGLIDDVNGYDFAYQDAFPDAVHDHGVNVAGVVAASVDNGNLTAGIASGVQIMPVKVLNDAGGFPFFTSPWVGWIAGAVGIQYAVDKGAHIVNCSWTTGDEPSEVVNMALQYALDNNVHLVFSAGNQNDDTSWPGEYPGTIAVAAIDALGTKENNSNFGSWVDLCGAGDLVPTTGISGTLDYFGGTSAAAANVTGVACLVLSEDGDLTPFELTSVLRDGAVDIDSLNPAHAGELGAGHANALGSLRLLEPVTDLGQGLAGHSTPQLNAWGLTGPGDTFTFSISEAKPNSACALVLGTTNADQNFVGSVLVPSSDTVLSAITDAEGTALFEFTLQSGIAPGSSIWVQFGVRDTGAIEGVALSNALQVTGI